MSNYYFGSDKAVHQLVEEDEKKYTKKQLLAKDMAAITTELVGLSLYYEVPVSVMLFGIAYVLINGRKEIHRIVPDTEKLNLV